MGDVCMSEKINPELELALSADAYKRDSSLYLGYEPESDTWTLIIRYSGDIGDLVESLAKSCVYLLGGFAIVKIASPYIEPLSRDFRVLYVDKPSYYSYGSQTVTFAKYASCITSTFADEYGLTGEGVCVGIVDSGIHIKNPEFMSDGGLRVSAYWDQNADYTDAHPNRYLLGRIFDRNELEDVEDTPGRRGRPASDHGTEIASVAAGSRIGVAFASEIIAVEQYDKDTYPDTISIMMGIDFLVRYSMEQEKPMVINLSYGSNYGAHDGTGVLELFIDAVSQMAKISVVTGTGNDGSRELHVSGMLGNVSFADLEIAVADGVGSFGVQIWKNYIDRLDVLVYSPSYDIAAYLTEGQTAKGAANGASVYGIYQPPSPYSTKQLVYIFFQSENNVPEGVWRVRLVPKSIVSGVYNAYLPGDGFSSGRVLFENSTANGSLTIPSTSRSVISVAAYDQSDRSLTGFSGRGYTADGAVKPDIAAPGVNVLAAAGSSGYVRVNGTSVSAAFVSGCAALLMEWGIVRGNDPFMYGERLKAQLIRGAGALAGLSGYPNRYVGWGTVCMADSIKDIIP